MSDWKNNRPEKGWAHQRSEYFEHHQPRTLYGKTRQADYEAGADAILGAFLGDVDEWLWRWGLAYLYNLETKPKSMPFSDYIKQKHLISEESK